MHEQDFDGDLSYYSDDDVINLEYMDLKSFEIFYVDSCQMSEFF